MKLIVHSNSESYNPTCSHIDNKPPNEKYLNHRRESRKFSMNHFAEKFLLPELKEFFYSSMDLQEPMPAFYKQILLVYLPVLDFSLQKKCSNGSHLCFRGSC